MKKSGIILLVGLVKILTAGNFIVAQTITVAQSGNWSSTSTWTGGQIPLALNTVIINGGFTVNVDVNNAACLNLQLGGSVLNSGAGTLTFSAGSQLTVTGIVALGPFNSNTTAGSLSMTSGGTLSCNGLTVGRLGTWTAGTGTILFNATNSIPADNNVIFNNLIVNSGVTTISRNVTVNGNLVINSGGIVDGGANTLTLAGDLINNGTFTGNTGTVTFSKNGNAVISGTGINNFNLIRVNLGTSVNNTLEVTSSTFNASDPFLTLTNGTFKISGSFAFSNTFITGPIYNIQPGTGLWINNPNVNVTAQAGGVSVRGLLRVSAGTYNIGNTADNSLDYVTPSSIIIEGGSVNIAGRLARNNATATTSYTQTGGTVTVVGVGSTDLTFAGFDLGATGSSFTMSGGTIVIRNSTSAPSDYLNASSLVNVTGGTIQAGDAATANAQTIRIESPVQFGNLLVSDLTTQSTKPTAKLITSGINLTGSVTIQPGTTLDANGLNINLQGDWTDNGTFISGAGTVTFTGAGLQTITGAAGETFNNLTINKTTNNVTLANSATVSGILNLALGAISVGSNTLTLNGSVTGSGTFSSSGTGTVVYNQATHGQNILAANYGNLTFSNFNKLLPSSGDIGISGTFTPGFATGHAVAGSTIVFNGGSQSIPVFPYNNLSLSGTGTKTTSGAVTASGNLINNIGIVFTGSTSLDLSGVSNSNLGTLVTGSLSIGSGATLANNGTATISTLLTGAGTLIQGNTGVLNLGGTITFPALNASAVGNIVNYSGSSQTIVPVAYHNLMLSGSGSIVLTGINTIGGDLSLSGTANVSCANGLTIGGNLTIGTGTSFDAGSFSHLLKGNILNSGSFSSNTSTFTLNGASPQTITSSNFNNLIVNNASGISILSDEIISGILTLTGGSLSIGSHLLTLNGTVSLGSGSLTGGSNSNLVVGGSGVRSNLPGMTLNNLTLNRASGDSLLGNVNISGTLTISNGTLVTGPSEIVLGSTGIISEIPGQSVLGNVRVTRNITTIAGTETFGNIGADISLNGVALGSTTILRKTGTVSTGNTHSSVKRYFDITPAINTGLNAGLIFHYDPGELNGLNEAIFELYRSRDNGIIWNNLGGTVNTTSHTITVTGLNDFSRWTVSDSINRIGNTAIPTVTSLSPGTLKASDPAFTLLVTGTEFLNGKSIIRFNGVDKTTTFISSTQLSAPIAATEIAVAGNIPVTVFNNGGGGLSNAQQLIVTVGVGINDLESSQTKLLRQNYPNPFNNFTTITYELPSPGLVSLKVFDEGGREIATLVDKFEEPGLKSVYFDAGNLPDGIYFCRLVFNQNKETRQLTLIR